MLSSASHTLIDYTYDALGRLTAANYDNGDFYTYTLRPRWQPPDDGE